MSHRDIFSNLESLAKITNKYAPYVFQLCCSIFKFCSFLFKGFLWIIAWMASHNTESQSNAEILKNQRQMPALTKTNPTKNEEALSLALNTTVYFLFVVLLSVFSENPRNTFFSITGGTLGTLGTLACVIIVSSGKRTRCSPIPISKDGAPSDKELHTNQSTTLIKGNDYSFFAQNRKRPVEHSAKASPLISGTVGALTGFAPSNSSGHFLETNVSIISRLMFAVAGFFAFTYAYSSMAASDKDKKINHPTPKNSILSLMFRSPDSAPPVPNANAYDPHATR